MDIVQLFEKNNNIPHDEEWIPLHKREPFNRGKEFPPTPPSGTSNIKVPDKLPPSAAIKVPYGKPPKGGPLRLNAKNFCLTWPRNDIGKEQLMTNLKKLFCGRYKYIVTCDERHSEGEDNAYGITGWHVHAFVQCIEKYDLRDANEKLDPVGGKHGNYQCARSATAWREYVMKDGNCLEEGIWKDNHFAKASELPTVKEQVDYILKYEPKAFYMGCSNILKAAEFLCKQKPSIFETKYPNTLWNTPDTIESWLKQEFTKTNRAKCLIVLGKTRLGKTEWARSLTHHMYWRGMINLEEWDDTANLIILDDIDWEYLKDPKSWLTCNGQATVTDKYCKKRTVVFNKPVIYLCNKLPEYVKQDDYWKENMIFVELDKKLY